MTMKDRILEKLNYKRIAEQIYEILEDEIENYVVAEMDENHIATAFAKEYSDLFLEAADSIISESIVNDVEYSLVKESFVKVVSKNID